MAFCKSCGNQFGVDYGVCPSCGQPTSSGGQSSGTVMGAIKASIAFVMKKPFRLWGLSLLSGLMSYLAVTLSIIPLLSLSIIAVLQLGMTAIYLDGYRGREIDASQLFKGFNKQFFRNAGGMGWMYLWIFIWAMIPVAGPFLAIWKMYSYRFTPYLLNNEPELNALEALKKSIDQTRGHCGKMFGADFLVGLFIGLVVAALFALMLIPFIGFIFGLAVACVGVLAPLLFGVIQAVFYDEITK